MAARVGSRLTLAVLLGVLAGVAGAVLSGLSVSAGADDPQGSPAPVAEAPGESRPGSDAADASNADDAADAADADNASNAAGAEDGDDEELIDPLSVNAACYVCHVPLVREEISAVHLAAKVTCIECHGLSAAHANDEDVGATPPDVTYQRCQVNPSCRECHKEHDAKPEDVVARWVEAGSSKAPVCTDCHGNHRIEEPQLEEASE